MLNDYLSDKESKERIKQNIQDAENDNLLRRLGYGTNRTIPLIFILIVVAVVAIGLLI
jgi:hypothetical protein